MNESFEQLALIENEEDLTPEALEELSNCKGDDSDE